MVGVPNGDKHSNFSVANSHEGSTLLVKKIYSALTSHSLDTVLIGLEATSVYGDNLVYFLREDATLAPFNRKIHVLNPKQVKKFHDTYNDFQNSASIMPMADFAVEPWMHLPFMQFTKWPPRHFSQFWWVFGLFSMWFGQTNW